jgi:hypothetical protein
MTVYQIKEAVMFQTNNDSDDLEDYLPFLDGYLNQGYDLLVGAWDPDSHVGDADYPPLDDEEDEPNLPRWLHPALVDYATWLVYRNGNSQKQNRGGVFLSNFQEALRKVTASGGAHGRVKKFINIPD